MNNNVFCASFQIFKQLNYFEPNQTILSVYFTVVIPIQLSIYW